jgi:hypothetical protein
LLLRCDFSYELGEGVAILIVFEEVYLDDPCSNIPKARSY